MKPGRYLDLWIGYVSLLYPPATWTHVNELYRLDADVCERTRMVTAEVATVIMKRAGRR